MLRRLALALALAAPATGARAAPAHPPAIDQVQVCDAGQRNCRLMPWFKVDPQQRLIWLLIDLPGSSPGASRLQLSALASSEIWFNGVLVGRNGRPGATRAEEQPGLMETSIPLPADLWQAEGNRLAIRMSSFQAPIRLGAPLGDIRIVPDRPERIGVWRLAPPLIAAGALLAGCLYFLTLHLFDPSRTRALLAALAGAALVQALAEMWRPLFSYAYPIHPIRLMLILAAAWSFAVLLAAFSAERFVVRRRWIPPVAAGVIGLGFAFMPLGFDARTAGALAAGAVVSLIAALLGVRRKVRGAKLALACMAGFLFLLTVAPNAFLDLSLHLISASLALALLVAEGLRLRRVASAREGELVRAASHPDFLRVTTGKGIEIVRLERIAMIVGADDYAELHLTDGRALLHAARLDHLEQALPAGFLRVHRSTIVNLAHVQRLARQGERWALETQTGATVPVSRARLASVRAAISG